MPSGISRCSASRSMRSTFMNEFLIHRGIPSFNFDVALLDFALLSVAQPTKMSFDDFDSLSKGRTAKVGECPSA